MPTDTRLDELLQRWEDGRRSGEDVPPEELCRDCPELLDPLRRAIDQLRRADDMLGTIRPPEVTSPGQPGAGTPDTRSEPPPDDRGPGVLPEARLRPGAEPVPGFRLVRELGAGGFGAVWLAEAPGGFPVAVKFVALAGRSAAAEVRSLDVLRRLHHPNLLTTFGAWQTPGHLIVAMELADRTLADRLAEALAQGHPGIPGPELLGYLRGAARALDYLNRPHHLFGGEPQGILHRDVKPQNLMLVGDTVKVGDFGLARAHDRAVTTHSGGMTPAYAPPEFFAGQAARQSDQYSLAVTYCQLRGGRLPFDGTLGEQLLGRLQGEPDLGMLPAEERPAVARALSRTPADRWPSCAEFVEALARSLAGGPPAPPTTEPVPRRDPSEPPVLLTRVSPRRRVAWLAGLLAVGVLAAAAGVWHILAPPPPGPPGPGDGGPPGAARPHKPPDPHAPSGPGGGPPTPTGGPGPQAVGERLRFGRHAKPVRAVAWVPDAGRVLSGGVGGELWLWDVGTGHDARRLTGHQETIHCVAVSADGRQALTGGDDLTVRLWDLASGQERKTFRKKIEQPGDAEFEMYGVAFIDGRRAVSAGNADIAILWDLGAGAEDGRLKPGLDEALCLALSPDGRRLVLGGKLGGLVERGLARDDKEVAYRGHADDVLAAAYFPDGERFVTAGGGDGRDKGREDYAVRVWRRGSPTPVELRGHAAKVNGVAVSPDGRRILSGDAAGDLRLWDAEKRIELPRFDRSEGRSSPVACVAFSPDGTEALSGHADSTVRVWVLPK